MAKFVFKWTKATKGGYPYNHNCVLTVNDKKVASTKGGGFDMQGVVLAMYLRKKYPQETQNMPDGTKAEPKRICPDCGAYLQNAYIKKRVGDKRVLIVIGLACPDCNYIERTKTEKEA